MAARRVRVQAARGRIAPGRYASRSGPPPMASSWAWRAVWSAARVEVGPARRREERRAGGRVRVGRGRCASCYVRSANAGSAQRDGRWVAGVVVAPGPGGGVVVGRHSGRAGPDSVWSRPGARRSISPGPAPAVTEGTPATPPRCWGRRRRPSNRYSGPGRRMQSSVRLHIGDGSRVGGAPDVRNSHCKGASSVIRGPWSSSTYTPPEGDL